ncbi:hypothetical protein METBISCDRAFT_27377 [Metschnikowia bicuspidata]|uniref:Palmitoyltransferase n=1 Tax=Metschnikowia bicuspidata TaxID=27322 RepID=A0A4P9ZC77_9ASCO|nr:hypothetical protein METBISCDRAFT_27377 [Metschnikowia bicuspidata]
MHLVRGIAPTFVASWLVYGTYVSSHVVGYSIFFDSLRATAIVLWALLAVLVPSMVVYWAILLVRGPGTLDPLRAPGPGPFLSDALGFPLYCSHCQQIKPERAFHLSFTGRCVPRYDHYCVWLGAAVGRDNLVPFFNLVRLVAVYSALSVVFSAVALRTMHRRLTNSPSLLLLLIVSLIVNSFAVFMLFGLVVTTAFQIATGRTALDAISVREAATQRRWDLLQKSGDAACLRSRLGRWFAAALFPPPKRFESGLRYVNLPHEDSRAVVCYRVGERPYSCGVGQDLVDAFVHFNQTALIEPHKRYSARKLFLAITSVFVPYLDLFSWHRRPLTDPQSYDAWSDEFAAAFLSSAHKSVADGEFLVPAYVAPAFGPKPLP